MVAAAANDFGWRVVYLGPSLPASEIAGAAVRTKARAVALSLVYPADDPNLPAELETLRTCLPASIRLLVGGHAAPAYRLVLERIGATCLHSLGDVYAQLAEWRLSPPEEPTAP